MNKIVIGIIFALGIVCLIGGSVFVGIFPGILKNKINEEMPLVNGSDSYTRWKETKVPITMKFHFFHLNDTNFKSLDDIVLVERGPYLYEEKRFKQDISKAGDSLITYRENKTYTFRPNKDKKDIDENKEITFINFPFLGVIQNQLADLKKTLVSVCDSIYHGKTEDETDLFVTKKPVDILFNGVPYKVFKALSIFMPKLIHPNYGIYDSKKFLEEDWTINSGENDIKKLGQLYKFDKKLSLTNDMPGSMLLVWPNTNNKNITSKNNCTQLKGTDGTLFAPDVSKEDILYAFEPQLCRHVFFSFEKETEVRGITTYRFKVDDNFYKRPKEYDANSCYCVGNLESDRCDKSGLLDISHCIRRSFGAPILMSPPYFKNGNSSLREQFGAELKPKNKLDDDNYGTYLDIEPMTGTVLKAVRRLQMNVEIQTKDLKTNQYMRKLGESSRPSYIIPVFWIEESGEADEDQANEFKSMVINKKKLANGLSITFIVVGALLAIVSIYLFIRNR